MEGGYKPAVREVIPIRGSRRAVARAMLASKEYYPQATAMFRADLSALVAFREEMKAQGVPVSYAGAFAKAAACAVRRFPLFNAARLEKEIHIFENVNISVATHVEGTLYVPVIRDAQSKDAAQISGEIRQAAEHLKNGEPDRVVFGGSTFTLSNLGNTIIDGFTPMLTVPETSILGFGRTVREVCAGPGDTIGFRWAATVSMTTDHAVIDGMPKAQFLEYLQEILLHPHRHLMKRGD